MEDFGMMGVMYLWWWSLEMYADRDQLDSLA